MKFSLVIPLAPYRDAEIVESIKKLNYPHSEFQIIIVKGTNASANRNKGALRAKGEIIGFLDDDAVIEPDFLKKVEYFFNKHPETDIVGGPQLTPKDEKGFALISGYALSSKFGAAGSSSRYKEGKINLNADEKSITSANLFVKKEVMEKVQFDTSLWPGEDPKFIADSKKEGLNIAYSPDFTLFHRRRPTLRGLIKQIFNYGRVRPLKENFIETLKMPIFLVPVLFVIYLLALLWNILINPQITGNLISNNPLNIKSNWLFIPLVAYLSLAILFSVYECEKNKHYFAVLLLPFIYPIIHLSYGCGMIYGYYQKSITVFKSTFF